jgi:hypothetical protein
MRSQLVTEEFLSDRAKAFLVDRVMDQAAREGTPLSDVERKMLTFSETIECDVDNVTLEAFEKLDENEYEAKVAGLIKRAYTLDKKSGDGKVWTAALNALEDQDFYMLVMVDQAGLGPPMDLKLGLPSKHEILVTVAFIVVFLAGGYFIFFDFPNGWAKLVLFAVWALTLFGIGQIKSKEF